MYICYHDKLFKKKKIYTISFVLSWTMTNQDKPAIAVSFFISFNNIVVGNTYYS